jgi:hypothetical protein
LFEELVSDGVKWVSSELKYTKSKCVHVLSYHGVINGLAGLPACTRFAYIVYANKDFQNELIETMKSKKNQQQLSIHPPTGLLLKITKACI